jgi:hypothetical protein
MSTPSTLYRKCIMILTGRKKVHSTLDNLATVVRQAAHSQLSWSKRGLRLLRYLAQRLMPLLHFYECLA